MLEQMRFNPNLSELIHDNQLDSAFGGSYEFNFEPHSYWDQIVKWVLRVPFLLNTSLLTCSTPELVASHLTGPALLNQRLSQTL